MILIFELSILLPIYIANAWVSEVEASAGNRLLKQPNGYVVNRCEVYVNYGAQVGTHGMSLCHAIVSRSFQISIFETLPKVVSVRYI